MQWWFWVLQAAKLAPKKNEDGKMIKVVKELVANKSAVKPAGLKNVKHAAPIGVKKPKTSR